MRRLSLALILSLFFLSCYNEPEPETQNIPNRAHILLSNYNDTIFYSLGLIVGRNIKSYGIEKLDFNAFNAGIADAFSENKKPIINPTIAERILSIYLSKYKKAFYASLSRKNAEFLRKNALRKGVILTSSGMQYEILKKGTGIRPSLNDYVVVHYRGMLIDGTTIGNTYGKSPVKFMVRKSIKGWQEALTMMREGAKWRIYLPPQLAFGKKGGKKIKPNSVVIYDIELLKVIKNS